LLETPIPTKLQYQKILKPYPTHEFHRNMARQNPNIIVTGTPGVGKTTHAEQLARSTGLKHISVNQIVKDEGFHEGKDEETGSWIVDEDKVRRNFVCFLSS
jgi:nucleoside-triphosphatase THEP1